MKIGSVRPFFLFSTVLLATACAGPAPRGVEEPSPAPTGRVLREPIEWCNIWITDAQKDDLPRVLLVGDSITQGYYGEAAKALAGKAYVGRLTTSLSVCHPAFLDLLVPVLRSWRFDVIQFNNGIHGEGYTLEEYREGLERTFRFLEKRGRGAKLLWAATTPARFSTENAERNAQVEERNAAALELCRKHGIPVIDLHALMKDKDELHRDDFHYKGEALRIQGKAVAEFILPFLEQVRS